MSRTVLAGRAPTIFDYSAYAFLTGADAETVTELVLVRHGQQAVVDVGDSRPFSDVIDPPLSALGRRQAELVGGRFTSGRVDAVYSSALLRAHATATEIARRHDLDPVVVHDLREIELFRDLPPGASVVEHLGEALALGIRERMLHERSWDVYPYSEGSAEFRRRTVNAIEGIAASHDGGRVVVACHGGVINAYVAHHLGIAQDMFFRPAHTAVNVVVAGRHGVRALQSLGDVHHLESEAGLVTH